MTDTYLTIGASAEAEIEVKRSRFRCRVERVGSEADARAVVDAARAEHWQARHHCSAFVLGPDGALTRCSDDGEPAGTAGVPMLEVLTGRGLTEVVAVVTRWFGGTLLGVGGLARAYAEAVREALAAAPPLRRRLLTLAELRLDHADAGRVESELRRREVPILDVGYGSAVTLRLGSSGDGRVLAGIVAELTGGAGRLVPAGQAWVDEPG